MRLFENKIDNYAKKEFKPKLKCLNCGRDIPEEDATDLYSRRFCSQRCKADYLGHSE